MLSASIFSQNKLCSHLTGSCHDIYIWVTIIKPAGNMSVEISARQTVLPINRESEYRISRFDLSTNYPVGGQVFPSSLSILQGDCRPLLYLFFTHFRLAGSRKIRQSILSVSFLTHPLVYLFKCFLLSGLSTIHLFIHSLFY